MIKSRSIFEEVDGARSEQTPPPKATPKGNARTAIARWLMVLFALVVLMISVGGMTRLTDSGLSITEWRPVTGALPPMSAEAWASEFEKYRAIPEYQLQNRGMSLSEFKTIYWWEWGHRQLGRVIGLVWALGFFWFLARGRIPKGWTVRLLGLGALGGLQGAIGWWMVSSGLSGTVLDVASYRLATHLGLAFIILGLIAWYIFQLGRSEMDLFQARRRKEARLVRLSAILIGMVMVQILLGALVAGIDAGRYFPSWPLMAGQFIPPDVFDLEPGWRNWFENAGLVQFNHRIWAYLILAKGLFIWWRARGSALSAVRRAFDWMAVILFGQMVIGIVTVMYGAPWQVAIVHQLLAVVLWVLVIRARFVSLFPEEERIARS